MKTLINYIKGFVDYIYVKKVIDSYIIDNNLTIDKNETFNVLKSKLNITD